MADLMRPQEIASRLRELQRTSPTERSALAAWGASARQFWNEVGIPLPADVMHYLHDADIQIKDPAYRDSQNEMIMDIISSLESGIVPESTGLTISFRPRWLGVVGLVLLVAIYLIAFK